jgi:FkbM family methyltransferase
MGEKIPDFKVPADCLPGVGEVWAGQYDFKAVIKGGIRVLDIGANCGAFALWARRRWPECQVTCYEPAPMIYRCYLKPNTSHDGRIECVEAAVGEGTFTLLRPGLDTRLCCSLYDLGRQGNPSTPVKVIAPEALPVADLVKIDTEGAEGYIVEHLAFVPVLLAVEYHSERLRERVMARLEGKMELMSCDVLQPGLGILKFYRAKGA